MKKGIIFILVLMFTVSWAFAEKGAPIQYDPADYPAPARQGGETVGDATVIGSLPYNDAGTTVGYVDDYDEVCPYTGSTSPDVVYSFTPTDNITNGFVSLCGDTDYDSKLYIYENTVTPGAPFACNDDVCTSALGQSYVSELTGLTFALGNTYYIVVDGYGGASGGYEIDVTGDSAGNPIISVSPMSISETLDPDEMVVVPLTIENTGTGDLTFNISVIEPPTDGLGSRRTPITNLSSSSSSSAEEDPNWRKTKTPFLTDEMWDLQFAYDVDTPSGLTGISGAETDGTYLYGTKWAGSEIVKFDLQGNFIETFTIPGVTGLRDLAYDGTYFYGSNASNYIWEMDFDTQTLLSTITTPGSVRSIAYDSDLDGFWYNNFSTDLHFVDRSGTLLNTILTPPSMYGCAYDNLTAGGPYLWIFTGTSSGAGCQVEQYDLNTLNLTGVTHSVSGDLGADAIAGGLFLQPDLIAGTYTLGGLAQGAPDYLYGYEIGLTGTPDPWLTVSPVNGTVPGGTSVVVDVTLNAADLFDITKTADLVISNNAGAAVEVDVTMNVTGGGGTALTLPVEEGFEGGVLPDGWMNEYEASTTDWEFTYGVNSTHPADPHTGSFNAYFNGATGDITKLVTPQIDMGTATDVTLTFWHAQEFWSPDQDFLRVYYKDSEASAWVMLAEYLGDIPAWTEETITLPNPSGDYYVAFEAEDGWGYGIGLDDISITGGGATTQDPPENLMVTNMGYATWEEPVGSGPAEFRYDDGIITAQLGFGANPNAIMGGAHPNNAVIDEVTWYLTSNEIHTEAIIYIFGLQPDGTPDTGQLLHESALLPNVDDAWNTYTLATPITASGGFFIGVCTPNIFTAIGTDDGVGAPWEFQLGTQWGISDWTAGNAWLDVGPAGFPFNFSIRASGTDNGEITLAPRDDSYVDYANSGLVYSELNTPVNTNPGENRDFLGYNVYLDGSFVTFTTDLFYQYTGLVEGTIYFAEVTADYDEGESVAIDYTFTYSGGGTFDPPINVTVDDETGTISWFPPLTPVIEDNFDSYTSGDYIAVVGDDWTTWSNAPGGAEDAFVTDAQAYSPDNSIVVELNQDLVLIMDDYTTGKYSFDMKMYVPTGYCGYFNLQKTSTPGQEWAFQIYYQTDGMAYADMAAEAAYSHPFNHDEWMDLKVMVDLDNDWATYYFNGEEIGGYQWTLGTFGTPGLLQFGGVNIFGGANATQPTDVPMFYVDDVVLSTVSDEVTGFNLYLDGVLDGSVAEDVYDYTYIPLVEDQTYIAGVSAVHTGGESDIVEVEFTYDPDTSFDPPSNPAVAIDDYNDVIVTWEAPSGAAEWMRWDFAVNNGAAIGLTNPGTFYVASHWNPADLADYDGAELTKIEFFPNELETFIMHVWTGPNAGTLVSSEPVTTVEVGTFQEVVLSTPVTINASQELWFGYEVVQAGATHPAGTDDGPAVQELGDMISLDGTSWTGMSAAYGLDYNWNLAAFVQGSDGEAIVLSKPRKTTVKAASRSLGTEPSPFSSITTRDTRSLAGYKIYQDGVEVGDVTDPATLTYTDESLDAGTYEYTIMAYYTNPDGESVLTDPVNATVVLDCPTNVDAQFQAPNVIVTWSAPARGIDSYNVYRDGVLHEEGVSGNMFIDIGVPAGTYMYSVTTVFDGGWESDPCDEVEVIVTSGDGILKPTVTELTGNYPNPFNPTTSISFSLKEAGHVSINVYNMRGQLVKTLVNTELDSDFHNIVWDGRDNSGKNTSSGVYFYKMKAQNYNSTKKMILMK